MYGRAELAPAATENRNFERQEQESRAEYSANELYDANVGRKNPCIEVLATTISSAKSRNACAIVKRPAARGSLRALAIAVQPNTMQNGHMSAAIRFLSLAIDHLSGAPTVPSPVGRFPSNFAD